MSLSDAYIRVFCDGCGEEEEIELPFVYRDYSGRNGYYDHADLKLPKGWVSPGLGNHRCPECVDEKSRS